MAFIPQPNAAGSTPHPSRLPGAPGPLGHPHGPPVYLSRFDVLKGFLPFPDCPAAGEALAEALRPRSDIRTRVRQALGNHQRFLDAESGYSDLFEDFHPHHPMESALRTIGKLGFLLAGSQGDTALYTHPLHGQYFVVQRRGPAAPPPPLRRRRKRPAPDPTPARVTFLALYEAASPVQLAEGAKGSHALGDGRRVTFVSLVPYPGHAEIIQKLLPHCLNPWPVIHPQLPRWHRPPP